MRRARGVVRSAFPSLRAELAAINWATFALLLAIGFVGGLAARLAGLPIPFLIGSLIVVGLFTILWVANGHDALPFPQRLRQRFVSVIGVMIGSTFSPEVVSELPATWPSLCATVLYVLIASGFGYLILRHLGRYDRVTAFYGSVPGGLIEATTLGEQAGGDIRILSVQHFIRIVLVVVTVPLLFLLWSGDSVGSAAGQVISTDPSAAIDVVLTLLIAIVGVWVAPILRIPAPHLMGPLILSVGLHSTGLIDLHSPAWLLSMAQLVVGAGLGAMFGGSSLRQLIRAVWLGALAVVMMLALALGFSLTLSRVSPVTAEALFISFAPGGVAEMGLIALSLGVSPVIVAAHHLVRIMATVVFAGYVGRHTRWGGLKE
ncbi:MAG: AbrB family transcriptional regulator [Acuticoccus sp.]